jgi:hypothetical protein
MRGDVSVFSEATKMESFNVSGCTGIKGDVSVFSAATKMESFNVSGCTGITGELPGALIKIISECKVAKFDGCEGPFTLPPTLGATADSIVKVDLSSLGKALRGDVSVFSEATKMESFNVSGCTGITGELPGVLIKIISECKVAKFDGCEGPFTLPQDMRGMSVADLKNKHHFSAGLLRALGFSCKQLKDECGFSLAQLKEAGFSCKQLKEAGFSCKQLKDECGFSLAQLKEAGFSCKQLKEAGFSCKQLKDEGAFTGKELVESKSFSTSELLQAFKKGHQFVRGDPSKKVGQVVFAEGKVGVITYADYGNYYCKISYSDGSRNKDMFSSGYLQFANIPGYSDPVERVWAME